MRFAAAGLALMLAAPVAAQDAPYVEFASKVLAAVQPRSFASNREYCGTIAITGSGRLIASRARRGGLDGCVPRDPRGPSRVIASYHTHAAFDPGADSELPSASDLFADMAEGIEGWIATPGGRLWFINGRRGEARLVCGLGCLPADPEFVTGASGPIRERYSLAELVAREARR